MGKVLLVQLQLDELKAFLISTIISTHHASRARSIIITIRSTAEPLPTYLVHYNPIGSATRVRISFKEQKSCLLFRIAFLRLPQRSRYSVSSSQYSRFLLDNTSSPAETMTSTLRFCRCNRDIITLHVIIQLNHYFHRCSLRVAISFKGHKKCLLHESRNRLASYFGFFTTSCRFHCYQCEERWPIGRCWLSIHSPGRPS